MLSTTVIGNWVTAISESPLGARARGMYSTIGLSVMTMPAAWTLACRAMPSTLDAMSIHSRM